MGKKLLVFAKPKLGEDEAMLSAALERLGSGGFEIERVEADGMEDARRRIERDGPDAAALVVAGGDGSLNGLAAAISKTGRPLGILPLGTANDFAAGLEIPLDVTAAAEIILAGHTRAVDFGCIDGHVFLNVATLGLGVQAMRLTRTEEKRRFGGLAYALGVLRALAQRQSFRATIESDGETAERRLTHLSIANQPRHGGGMVADERTTAWDRSLTVLGLPPEPLWRLLLRAPGLVLGKGYRQPSVLHRQAKEVKVTTRPKLDINADGEPVARTPAVFTVRERALQVFVPQSLAREDERA